MHYGSLAWRPWFPYLVSIHLVSASISADPVDRRFIGYRLLVGGVILFRFSRVLSLCPVSLVFLEQDPISIRHKDLPKAVQFVKLIPPFPRPGAFPTRPQINHSGEF